MIDGGKEDQRRNRDVARHQRQSFCGRGRHLDECEIESDVSWGVVSIYFEGCSSYAMDNGEVEDDYVEVSSPGFRLVQPWSFGSGPVVTG